MFVALSIIFFITTVIFAVAVIRMRNQVQRKQQIINDLLADNDHINKRRDKLKAKYEALKERFDILKSEFDGLVERSNEHLRRIGELRASLQNSNDNLEMVLTGTHPILKDRGKTRSHLSIARGI